MSTVGSHIRLRERAVAARRATQLQWSIADAATYWLVLAGVYGMFGLLWYFSFKEKLIDQSGTMPAGLKHVYDGSVLASVPGLDAAWVILGVIEGLACLAFAISLARGEFRPSHRKDVLFVGLGISLVVFATMLGANAMVADFEAVAELFGYFAGACVVMIVIMVMPPHGPSRWLSSFARGS